MTYTIVIADLHGMSNLLDKALVKIDNSGLDVSKIVFTGDYIDRGPDSAGVVARVRELVGAGEAIALKGNHEDMMAQAFDEEEGYVSGNSPWWIPNGGNDTIESYRTTYSQSGWITLMRDALWMKGLPLYHLDDFRIYVHGFADFDQPRPELFTDQGTMWERYDKHEDVGWFGKHVVHGHTPRKKPELKTHRTNLDTGAVFGGPLSVGVFDDTIPGGPIDVWEITGGA